MTTKLATIGAVILLALSTVGVAYAAPACERDAWETKAWRTCGNQTKVIKGYAAVRGNESVTINVERKAVRKAPDFYIVTMKQFIDGDVDRVHVLRVYDRGSGVETRKFARRVARGAFIEWKADRADNSFQKSYL